MLTRISPAWYKFLLTISITPVASFSTLKYIQSRLRSLSASKLETFMLMVTEKDVLVALDTVVELQRRATEETVAVKK